MNQSPRLKATLNASPLGDELVVFDAQTEKAHCLSLLGRQVYEVCAQAGDLDQLVTAGVASQEQIEQTLAEFETQGLLEASPGSAPSRRQFLVGAATAALAITASSIAPRPASAITCVICELDASGFPQDCADCGQPCIDVIGDPCTATSVCCFEFRRRTQNEPPAVGNGSLCQGTGLREVIGQFACRDTSVIPFNQDCNTMRAGVAIGQQYYCCCCAGLAQLTTPISVPANACC